MKMQLGQCFGRAKPLRLKKDIKKKKPEFQNPTLKMPNLQPCTRPATA